MSFSTKQNINLIYKNDNIYNLTHQKYDQIFQEKK